MYEFHPNPKVADNFRHYHYPLAEEQRKKLVDDYEDGNLVLITGVDLGIDYDLIDRLAAAARVRVIQGFDHRVMAERSLAIYRNILTGEPIADQPSLAA